MADEYYNGIIAKVASNKKFLEFKDGMTAAYPKDYAMLQGAVGSQYATNSGIRIEITDYTDAKETKHAGVLVPTYVFDQIYDICMKNNGQMIAVSHELNGLARAVFTMQKSYSILLDGLKKGIAEMITKPGDPAKRLVPIGTAVKNAAYALAGFKADKTPDETIPGFPNLINLDLHCDWSYNQTRVPSQFRNPDGTCNCSVLTIARRSFSDITGNMAYKKTWFFNLSRFKALPVEHDNGTVSYDKRSIKEKLDLNFVATDDEMLRSCYAISHFVNQWERAHLETFKQGEQLRMNSLTSSQNKN